MMGETSVLTKRLGIDPLAGELSASLETGHVRIDRDHRQLLALLGELRRICRDPGGLPDCATCSADQQLACEGRLIVLLGDLFSCILEHFAGEELLMRDAQMQLAEGEHYAAHIEDHAAIAQKVQELVARLDIVHTVERIRELDGLLARWVANHIEMHDDLLVRWLAKRGIPGAAV